MDYLLNKEQYLELKKHWKQNQPHNARGAILYNLLRGFDAKRGFTAITNQKKLANGFSEWHKFDIAERDIKRDLTAYVPTRWMTIEQINARKEQRNKNFELEFGIQLTDELADKLLKGLLK